jgi:hypothetical protein
MSVPLNTREGANLLSKGNAHCQASALERKGKVRSVDYLALGPIHAIK